MRFPRMFRVAAAAFAAGSAATALAAGAPWRVFATSTDSGDYGAYASADASAPRSSAFAVRATSQPGRTVDVSFYLNCEGERKVPSGALVAVTVPGSKKCSLHASADTDYSGRVRVELLRR